MASCIVFDCCNQVIARDLCSKHYQRACRDGTISTKAHRKPSVDLAEHIFSQCDIDPHTGCRLWRGAQDSGGYGHLRVRGVMRKAHRIIWTALHGAIPDGLHVCHKCDVPRCLNPEHLFLGTNAENMADRNAKGRQARGERNHAKLTDEMVRTIRHDSGTYRALAAKYGVNVAQISRVKNWQIWRHVS